MQSRFWNISLLPLAVDATMKCMEVIDVGTKLLSVGTPKLPSQKKVSSSSTNQYSQTNELYTRFTNDNKRKRNATQGTSFFSETLSMEKFLHYTECRTKRESFLQVLDKNREFIKHSEVVDCYLISMVFIYFERAKLSCSQYNEWFFPAYFLAAAMEEDSIQATDEVIVFCIGFCSQQPDFDYIRLPAKTYSTYKEWKDQVTKFNERRDKMWKMIQFNAYVKPQACMKAMTFFEGCPILSKKRRDFDLVKMYMAEME